jgi:hypothetical protein
VPPRQYAARQVVQLPAHTGGQHKAARSTVIVPSKCRQRQWAALQPELLKQHEAVPGAGRGAHQRLLKGARVGRECAGEGEGTQEI